METSAAVIDGRPGHRDPVGTRGVLHPGKVQGMSAGKGIAHAEFNASQTEPVHLLQLWVLPRRRGLPPRWEQRRFSKEQRAGRLLPVVTATDGATSDTDTLRIDQDATIYVSSLKPGESVEHRSRSAGRKAYLFVIDG